MEVGPGDDESLRQIVDRLAEMTTCASCTQPLSVGFQYLRGKYRDLRQQELAASCVNSSLGAKAERSCRDHARALHAIYRRDHPNCG